MLHPEDLHTHADAVRSETAGEKSNSFSATDLSLAAQKSFVEQPTGLLGLAKLAASSLKNGFEEPALGTLQLAEQIGNSAIALVSKDSKPYFAPEKLLPAPAEQEFPKYSAAWFISNAGNAAGKLPWYVLGSKLISKVPGFRAGEGLVSETGFLGMNLKTSAATGFLIGGMSPTSLLADSSLSGSLKERSIQAALGSAQMAMITVGTEFAGRGLTGAGKLFATTNDAIIGGTTIGQSITHGDIPLLTRASERILNFSKNGGIAAVGSIPAGLTVGYANSKIHGTEFDPVANVVSNATIGFGLGGFGGGESKAADVEPADRAVRTARTARTPGKPKADNAGSPDQTNNSLDLAHELSSPVQSTEMHDTLAGKIHKTTLENGTIIEVYSADGLTIKRFTDGTVVHFSERTGTRTEYPDGSEQQVDSYKTSRRDASGEWTVEENKWLKAYNSWDELPRAEKIAALQTVDFIPPGGNLRANLVEVGFGDKDPELNRLAAEAIPRIENSEEQLNQWMLAMDYHPELKPDLLKMIPTLNTKTFESIYAGRGMGIQRVVEHLSEKYFTSTNDQASSFQSGLDDYVRTVKAFPKYFRKQIWDQLAINESGVSESKNLEPIADAIIQKLNLNDPAYSAAFGEFLPTIARNFDAVSKITSPDVKQVGNIKVKGVGSIEVDFDTIKNLLKTAADPTLSNKDAAAAEDQARTILDNNNRLDLQKKVIEWGLASDDPLIKEFTARRFSMTRRDLDLTRDIIKLAGLDELPASYDLHSLRERPYELAKRAAEYHISDAQILATKQNVLQLLQIADANRGPDGQLTRAGNMFRMAALQSLVQAADPFSITQSEHPTCALAQVEFSTYMKHPDEATRLVSEVVRTGRFVTADGSTIVIDPFSMRPVANALDPVKDIHAADSSNYRSYASQIFQMTAANIFWQRQTTDLNGASVPPGSIRYEIGAVPKTDQRGNTYLAPQDKLMDYSHNPPKMIADNPTIYDFVHQLEDIGRQLDGERTVPSVANFTWSDETSFRNYVTSLPYPESFPLLVGVDSQNIIGPAPTIGRADHEISVLAPWMPGSYVYFKNTWKPGHRVSDFMPVSRFSAITEP